MKQQHFKRKLILLALLVLILCFLFLTFGIPSGVNSFLLLYIIKTRYQKLLALLLVAVCIAVSTLVFQTVTNNRIITPSIIGLDSLYVFIQTFLLFFLGSQKILMLSSFANFLLALAAMLTFSYLLFRILFRQQGYSVYFILLVGMVLNTFFSSVSSFLQMVIDPTDFLILQSSLFASFNAINTDVLALAAGIVFSSFVIQWRKFKYLDVFLLGKEKAMSLGLDYDRLTMSFLLWVSCLVAIATALVGPITFLGLLVANLAYQLFKTHKHSILLLATTLIATVALVGGQHLVQNVFALGVQLSVILNLIGGLYFIFILIREGRHT